MDGFPVGGTDLTFDWALLYHSNSRFCLKMRVPFVNDHMVTNQKSIISRVVAKPPRMTTVDQTKAEYASLVAAISRNASPTANKIILFSGTARVLLPIPFEK